ncbi:MAG: antitoxin Xre/MbcA/ParS toxin-binding domain-containing protein [Ilumatobacteraceae bacterium]
MASSAALRIVALDESEVRNGVDVGTVANLARVLEMPMPALLEWLQIAPRTWARRKQAGVLDLLESDRTARLTRLIARAADVTGGTATARVWLTTPSRALGRRTPLDVAGTEVGADSVFALLGRLDHGVFT